MKGKKTRRSRRAHRGGRKIGEGTYGCVFSPALRCKGDDVREEGMISKLMHKGYAAAEYKTAAVIKEIDPDQKFSIYPTRICDLDQDKLRENNVEDKYLDCKGVTAKTLNEMEAFADEFKVIQMPYGGTELNDLRLTVGTDVIAFFESLLPLISGMKRMHAANYYHFDIKPGNIVAKRTTTGFITRIIDFGFGTRAEDIITGTGKSLVPHQQNYPIWPFEFRWLTHAGYIKYSNMLATDYAKFAMEIDEYYRTSVRYNLKSAPVPVYYMADESQRETIYSQLGYMNEMNGKDYKYTYGMYGKIDVYSFGLVLCKLFITCFNQYKMVDGKIYVWTGAQFVKIDDYTPATSTTATMLRHIRDTVTIPFYEFVEHMLDQNPHTRYSMEDVEREFPAILLKVKRAVGVHAHVARMIDKRLKEETPYIGNLFPEEETPLAAAAAAAAAQAPKAKNATKNNYIAINM